MNRGTLFGLAAYTMWGFFPIYWKLLADVSASEILVNRIIWSLVFLVILLGVSRQWNWLSAVRRDRKTLVNLMIAACLLAINWFTYIWGVNSGYIVETSLGYFINPLVNVLLGVLILRERLRVLQWVAVGVAALGVIYLTYSYGSLPWIALTLAFSFGFYGLIKKRNTLAATESLAGEMSVLALPAIIYLGWLILSGDAAFGSSSTLTHLLLVFSGVVTATPLILFAAAAHRIPLSMLGLLQYIAPTLQFLIGIYVYGELFTRSRMIGFAIIWVALAIYIVDNIIHIRNQQKLAAVAD
ncbi:MAG: EamA family transporter RarD [Chloroflexota bacterium]|nr:EamA family transporter RarD [Chloroflexota bacterium]